MDDRTHLTITYSFAKLAIGQTSFRKKTVVDFKQVLRDTTRRGHKLYDTTENGRQICLADVDGKILEVQKDTDDVFRE